MALSLPHRRAPQARAGPAAMPGLPLLGRAATHRSSLRLRALLVGLVASSASGFRTARPSAERAAEIFPAGGPSKLLVEAARRATGFADRVAQPTSQRLFSPQDIARAARPKAQERLPKVIVDGVIRQLAHPNAAGALMGSWKTPAQRVHREMTATKSKSFRVISQEFNIFEEATGDVGVEMTTELEWERFGTDAMFDMIWLKPEYGPSGVEMAGRGPCSFLATFSTFNLNPGCKLSLSRQDEHLLVEMTYTDYRAKKRRVFRVPRLG